MIDVPAPLAVGAVLDNLGTARHLSGPTRILAILASEEDDAVWLIELPRRSRTRTERTEYYVGSPRKERLSDLAHVWRTGEIQRIVEAPALDDNQRRALVQGAALQRLNAQLKHRDERFEVLRPLLEEERGSTALRPALALITDPTLPSQIRQLAKKCRRSTATIYCWLHRFLALGSKVNALENGYKRCGGPGKPKPQSVKLGRSTRLFKAKRAPRGYALQSNVDESGTLVHTDKLRLAHFYRRIKHGTSARDAYLLACATYWAHPSKEATQIELLPKHERPTFGQFMRWGKKLCEDKSVTELILGPRKSSQKLDARGGSVRAVNAMVGQRAAFDSTSTDTYLVSVFGRMRKLPPMTRSVIKEGVVGLIVGINCSWEPPSQNTALKTILHAASSKVEYCARFGITITDEDWPAMLFRLYLADNGEMKGQKTYEAGRQLGFDIHIAPAHRGDAKGDIEAQNHTDHQLLDETLPGNNQGGRHLERGEEHAAQGALWHYWEYMRELIWHVLDYNKEEVPDLQPLEMKMQLPDVRPTRLNIFKWLRQRQSAEVACNPEEIRAFMLPDHPAVITKNGLHLIAKIHGRERLVPRMRFLSEALIETGLMSEVRRLGKNISTTVKFDEADLTTAWLPTANGMLRLTCTETDSHWQRLTLPDWIATQAESDLDGDELQSQEESQRANRILARRNVTDNAKSELLAELAALDKKPSKKSYRDGLVANRDAEMEHLRAQEQVSVQAAKAAASAGATSSRSTSPPDSPTTPPAHGDLDEDYEDGAAAMAMSRRNQSSASPAPEGLTHEA